MRRLQITIIRRCDITVNSKELQEYLKPASLVSLFVAPTSFSHSRFFAPAYLEALDTSHALSPIPLETSHR